MQVSNDVGLVLQGGGTRGIFVAGVLDAMIDAGLDFQYVIGTSAGALAGSNYISGDPGRTKFLIIHCMKSMKFASPANLLFLGTFFNFDYLMNEVPVKVAPMNFERFNENPARFQVATLAVADGKAHYFEKKSCSQFTKAIVASSSLPYISKPVLVEGHYYLDGGPVAAIPFRKPLEDGIKKLVIVETRDPSYRKSPTKKSDIRRAHAFYGKHKDLCASIAASHETYNQDVEDINKLKDEGRAFVIQPQSPVTVGRAERNEKKLEALYQEGFDLAKSLLPDLLKFLGESDE
ncbi:MAG: patatin family protein [Bacilli bacterium]|nr:patatin family protein [Bacilli bacterium]